MPANPAEPIVLPELRDTLRAAAAHRSAGRTRRRTYAWGAAVLGALSIGASAAAVAGVLPGQLTPKQVEAQRTVANDVARVLEGLPAVTRAELSEDMQRALDVTTAGLGFSDPGRRLSRDSSVFLFKTEDDRYCILEESGASCTSLELLSPRFTFGYNPQSEKTSISVVALGDVSRLRAVTDDGRVHELSVPDGASTRQIPGKLERLTWSAAGQKFQRDVPVDISTPKD